MLTSSSHFWQTGIVYAVEFSHRSGRDLVNMAKKRTNVIPIIEDARHPARYRMLVGMVDVIFADVAQPDQVSFREENALSVFVLVVVMFCISPLFFFPYCSCASDLSVLPFSGLCSVRVSQSLNFFPLSPFFLFVKRSLHTQPTSVCSSMGCWLPSGFFEKMHVCLNKNSLLDLDSWSDACLLVENCLLQIKSWSQMVSKQKICLGSSFASGGSFCWTMFGLSCCLCLYGKDWNVWCFSMCRGYFGVLLWEKHTIKRMMIKLDWIPLHDQPWTTNLIWRLLNHPRHMVCFLFDLIVLGFMRIPLWWRNCHCPF